MVYFIDRYSEHENWYSQKTRDCGINIPYEVYEWRRNFWLVKNPEARDIAWVDECVFFFYIFFFTTAFVILSVVHQWLFIPWRLLMNYLDAVTFFNQCKESIVSIDTACSQLNLIEFLLTRKSAKSWEFIDTSGLELRVLKNQSYWLNWISRRENSLLFPKKVFQIF